MARARNLKPGFFKDASVVACSFEARLLFQGLWCLADYMGRLKCIPIELKMEIFPADNVDVERCMSELSYNGLIDIYRDNSGSTLVQVCNFTKHQNPHINERQTKGGKPAPCLPGKNEIVSHEGIEESEKNDEKQMVIDATRVLQEYYRSDPADSLNLIPDSLFPNSVSAPAEPKPDKPKRKTKLPDDFLLTAQRARLAQTYWQTKNRFDLVPLEEFEKFRNHHTQHGKTMADWDAAWVTWYTNAVTFNRPREGPHTSTRQSSLVHDLNDKSWAN